MDEAIIRGPPPLAVLTDFCRDKSMTSGDGCVIKFPRTEQTKLLTKNIKNRWELHYEHEVGNFS